MPISSVTFFAICTTAAPSATPTTGHVVTLKIRSSGSVTSARSHVLAACPDRAVGIGAAAQADLVARQVAQLGDRTVQVRRQRRVAAQQSAARIEHRNRIANRVEGRFPLLLALQHVGVEPGVLHGHANLTGNDRDHAPVVFGEAMGLRAADAERAQQLGTREERHAQSAPQRQVRGLLGSDDRAQIVEVHRRTGLEGLVARALHADPRPQRLHLGGADNRGVLEEAGQWVEQTDRPAGRFEHLQQALQRAPEQVPRIERSPQVVTNVVDQLQLPHGAAIREVDLPPLDGVVHDREQLIEVERLRHVGEHVQLVGLDSGLYGVRIRHDDHFGLGVSRLDPADDLEAGLFPQEQIHQRHVDHCRFQRADGIVDGRRGQRGVPVSARLREEPSLQVAVGFDDQDSCTLHGRLSGLATLHTGMRRTTMPAHTCARAGPHAVNVRLLHGSVRKDETRRCDVSELKHVTFQM